MRVIVGIVGYYGFVRGYPLGPELMERLRALPWPDGAEIREMNWGPIAIVQDFQASADKPDRVVLVGALDRGLAGGAVSCRRWVGGVLDPLKVQQRMFEAVTGVISLDNLLAVGEQFRIWPGETYTVELQWPESGLGDLVLGEIEIDHPRGQVVGDKPLTPENEGVVQILVGAVRTLALEATPPDLPALTFEQLTPVAQVTHHGFVEERGALQ
ncbi:MAG: hypothetical protein ACOZJZ_23255 [Pseudomonadota bacterium]|jgi:hypothetical protein